MTPLIISASLFLDSLPNPHVSVELTDSLLSESSNLGLFGFSSSLITLIYCIKFESVPKVSNILSSVLFFRLFESSSGFFEWYGNF